MNMTEKQTELNVEDETVQSTKTTDKTSVKDDIKAKQDNKVNKYLKQENFTTKEGQELTVTFPGIEATQDIIDEANAPEFSDQYLSAYRLHVLLLDKILEDNLKIDDFDKELRKHKKIIEVEEDDGSTTKYELQFPKLGNFEQINEMQESTHRSKALNTFILQQVLTKPLALKYFDNHTGYAQILNAAKEFLATTYFDSEYKEVIDYIDSFVNRMFH